MSDEFIYDLRVARRKSGLTQADCGHLIGASPHQISDIERGLRPPTLRETHALMLLFGRSFESLHGPLVRALRRELMQKIETLPDMPSDTPDVQRRQHTLERLTHRLLVENQADHDG